MTIHRVLMAVFVSTVLVHSPVTVPRAGIRMIMPCYISDINECDYSPCSNGGICINSFGSFSCDCPKGWYRMIMPCYVSDINECDYSPCSNGGICINSFGSFSCDCPKGWH